VISLTSDGNLGYAFYSLYSCRDLFTYQERERERERENTSRTRYQLASALAILLAAAAVTSTPKKEKERMEKEKENELTVAGNKLTVQSGHKMQGCTAKWM